MLAVTQNPKLYLIRLWMAIYSCVDRAIINGMNKAVWSAKIEGKPVSTNTAYPTSRQGRRYMSKSGKEYKALVRDTAQYTYPHREPIDGPVQIHITYIFGDKRIRDVNNYDKIIVDALEGIIYKNDTQVNTLLLHKEYGDSFSTEITVYAEKITKQ